MPIANDSARSAGAPLGDASGRRKIAHVVIVMQENRSFDNLFHGFPGADTANSGIGSNGRTYVLRPVSLADPTDISHAHYQFLTDYDGGKMDGFNLMFDQFSTSSKCTDPINQPKCWVYFPPSMYQFPFAFVPRNESAPYWTMARRYALADNAFESNNSDSYPSHQYMIAGQSFHVSEVPHTPESNGFGGNSIPWGCDAPKDQTTTMLLYGGYPASDPYFSAQTGHEVQDGPYTCFDYPTAATLLDNAKISWAYYAPQIYGNPGDIWSAFDAIYPVRFGTDWLDNVKSPETTIFSDIASGNLPSVAWVTPSFVNSDHAGSRSTTGPQWVAAVVNAIGTSKYWDSTAIVVMWDDWGGWYDHVRPKQIPDTEPCAPAAGKCAFEGLGFRVPAIVISPYAKAGYISHRRHEVASTLRLIENVFGLPSLQQADARTDGFDDMFDFKQQPLRFKRIPTILRASDFEAQLPSSRPPDDD